MRCRYLTIALFTLALSVAARADVIFTGLGSAGTGSDPEDEINLDDINGASIGGAGLGQLNSVTKGSGELDFDYTLPGTGNFGGGHIDVYRDLLDQSGKVEGIFRLQTDGGSTVHISYGSNIDLTGSTHLVSLFPTATDLVDNGTAQTMVTFCPSSGCGTVDAAGDDISTYFTVQPSSVPVPPYNTAEASSVAFLSLALLGLASYRRLNRE